MIKYNLFLAAAALLLLSGCFGTASDEVKLEPVSGKLLVDGEVMSGVSVMFSPADGEGTGAFGITDESGKYELKYRDGRIGAPAGTFKVTYSKLTMPDGSPLADDVTSPSEVGAIDQIPEKLRNVEGITETVTVPEGGTTIDLEIFL